ncbi:hypothetical protein LGN12_04725 [Burkholderia multivorans]|nr:hypothetical protein [Burkholderia multivorans]
MKQNPLTSSRRKFLEVAGAAPLLSACGGDDVASAPVTDAALAAQMSAKLNAQLGDAATVDAMLPVTDTCCRRTRPAGKCRRDGGETQRAAASAASRASCPVCRVMPIQVLALPAKPLFLMGFSAFRVRRCAFCVA